MGAMLGDVKQSCFGIELLNTAFSEQHRWYLKKTNNEGYNFATVMSLESCTNKYKRKHKRKKKIYSVSS